MRMTLGGQDYLLSVDILDYHGPGSYSIPPERVSLRPAAPTGSQLLPGISGQVAVAADEASGHIDVVLTGSSSTHLQGSWACR
jgi:hypothetical protein